MKKTKLLLGSAILSVALLGTGYAYWTDALTVNTTVGTGEFNVVMKGARTETLHSNETEQAQNKYIECKTVEVKDDIATLEFKNMYPGAHGRYVVDITNEGSIPAVIKDFTVSPSGNTALTDKIILCGTNISEDTVTGTSNSKTSFVPATAIKAELDKTFAGGRLEPGKTMRLMMEVIMDEKVANSDNGANLEKQTCGLEMKINWKQHNIPTTVAGE